MTVYYEEIIELWEASKFFDAISYFSEWLSKGLLSEEEIENFSKNLSKFWKLIEAECEENPAFMFNLYQMLKKERNLDDETLCKELRISERTIEEIKVGHKPGVEGLGLKMLYELFPQMAV